MAAAPGGCVPLGLVPLSEVGAVVAEFLEEAMGHLGGLEEIRAFIEVARDAAAGEAVVCHPVVAGEALELSLYTAGGRLLDRLVLPPERLPASAEATVGLLGGLVRLVREAPGR